MLLPLGWGEAALDVRFMSAHQGRWLVAMRPPGDRAVTGSVSSHTFV
jgi:hypothetical protein